MTDKEMDKLADIVASRVVDVIEARQKAWDIEFHADMQHFVSDNTSASVSKYDLKDELEELKSLLSQALVDEDYNRANDINEEIKKIKSKLK
tara:strand:- start:1692 stop:1967 length:276 start_codon:yes stop_codon:yes gene_type:complete